nr:MAG TPA: hypothetical protein [Caudoviricetes sp.]
MDNRLTTWGREGRSKAPLPLARCTSPRGEF